MSKTGDKPEVEGELKDFGGEQKSSMEEHKGPYVHGHEDDKAGRKWHGSKKMGGC